MLNATHLPIDPYGNLIPVGCHKSRGTQVLTLESDAVVYASSAFSGKTKVMASTTLAAAGDTITITSKIEGWESEEISVKVARLCRSCYIGLRERDNNYSEIRHHIKRIWLPP